MSMAAFSVEAGGKGNIQFQPNTSIAIIGATGTGKTWFVYRFLKHLDDMFVGERVSKVVYRYGVYQKLFDVNEAGYTWDYLSTGATRSRGN